MSRDEIERVHRNNDRELSHGAAESWPRTWNCTHIANAMMRTSIENICRVAGYEPPILCTPEELMEDW